jgi:aldehyde dehydrogenase (NAD+)
MTAVPDIGRQVSGLTGAFIDGQPAATHGPTLSVEDPATTGEIAALAEAGPPEVSDAVQSARAAFGPWRDLKPVARGRILLAIAAAIRRAAAELAVLETVDTGKPLSQSRSDVETAARYFEFYGGVADKVYGQTIPGDGDYWSYTLREPYGVIAHITPWNSPLSQMSRGVAPSLAAGNTVVVKPSELTPLSTLAVARLLVDAGLPPGVANVVAGRGPTTGAALAADPDVAHITFTGSVPTGKAILKVAADRVAGCNLELGGKSATIILADANFADAVRAGALAVVRNAGQSCFATTRLLVQRPIAEEYSRAVADAVSRLTVGPGIDDRDLGPLASRAQLDKVTAAISTALAEGASLAVGGTRFDALPGYFISPAVLTGVRNDMAVARQEVFGPVQSILTFDEADEAVALANDSAYGLAAGVFTRDISAAHMLARRLQAGQVQVNAYPLGGVDTPFGGYKESGLGREKGVAALDYYTQLKTVILKN